ncbi:MAG: heme exporter protein [Thermoleophilaceae bacterium]|nr:heme exporter protein [Thermoleophilaceae bacterium]
MRNGPGLFSASWALLRKDLAIELRTRESVPAMALFSVTVFVLLHFGTGRDTFSGGLAAGLLWVTLLLATVLGVNRLFVAEREQGGIDAVLLAPVDRTAVFIGKAAALFLYLVLLEVVAVPAFALLLLAQGSAVAVLPLAGVLLLTDIGLAAVGALVAAMASETRARDLVVPMLLLPLVVPLAIAGASATEPLLGAAGSAPELLRWLGFIGVYDMVFLLLSVAVFDFLLED